jgi:hypothetical protein
MNERAGHASLLEQTTVESTEQPNSTDEIRDRCRNNRKRSERENGTARAANVRLIRDRSNVKST